MTEDYDRRRILEGLVQAASAAGPMGFFLSEARRHDDAMLQDLLSELGGMGGSPALADSRRHAVAALLAQSLSSKQIATMERLSRVGTCLTVVAIVLAVVQAIAALIAILQHFGMLKQAG
jgi:hypothetical protein